MFDISPNRRATGEIIGSVKRHPSIQRRHDLVMDMLSSLPIALLHCAQCRPSQRILSYHLIDYGYDCC
jgi:hypothetical protein